MTRHWSFVVCDKRYIYPFAAVLMVIGVTAALVLKDPVQFNRVGNLVIGTGVWMTMRFTLREGINRYKNAADSLPVIPGTNQLNSDYFNKVTFTIGDAELQLHGFALVVLGSIIGSYGDVILKWLLPARIWL